MIIFYIVAILCGGAALLAVLYFEAKIIGMIATGLAAVFFIIGFINTQEATSQASRSLQARDNAEFDRDFARASGNSTKQEKVLLDERVASAIAKEKLDTAKASQADADAQLSRDNMQRKLMLEEDAPIHKTGDKPKLLSVIKKLAIGWLFTELNVSTLATTQDSPSKQRQNPRQNQLLYPRHDAPYR
jgi:RNase H-fold protein (predicted Holliday junction resolvase)